ncbi:MAG: peroxide stress protein YaaA [Gammaproteobacteria bacterium]|nr:peroxide stress protein YaaA [Gammaproteobacteria bacterium]
MLIIISPAKTLDFDSAPSTDRFTQPDFLDRSEKLVNVLSTRSPSSIGKLMNISPELAELNVKRFHHWTQPFSPDNAKQALLSFKGDVYLGLQADKFTPRQLAYAQDHLRILSGLYGVLRPLDLIQPYRLEMGLKLRVNRRKNLYEFWGSAITENINNQLKAIDSNILLNLSSNEYFKSIQAAEIAADIVSPAFKEWKNGQYKMLSFFAKTARGTMARWVLKNRVKTVKKLCQFDLDGYQYSEAESTAAKPVFLRKQS